MWISIKGVDNGLITRSRARTFNRAERVERSDYGRNGTKYKKRMGLREMKNVVAILGAYTHAENKGVVSHDGVNERAEQRRKSSVNALFRRGGFTVGTAAQSILSYVYLHP